MLSRIVMGLTFSDQDRLRIISRFSERMQFVLLKRFLPRINGNLGRDAGYISSSFQYVTLIARRSYWFLIPIMDFESELGIRRICCRLPRVTVTNRIPWILTACPSLFASLRQATIFQET